MLLIIKQLLHKNKKRIAVLFFCYPERWNGVIVGGVIVYIDRMLLPQFFEWSSTCRMGYTLQTLHTLPRV